MDACLSEILSLKVPSLVNVGVNVGWVKNWRGFFEKPKAKNKQNKLWGKAKENGTEFCLVNLDVES